MRRLKAVKDLSVLIVAPRRHDRKLWADLLKNCGINHPTAMDDIKQAAHFIGSGQADVVFVDESYGAQGIANVLIPARGVEFAGGRGVCLILTSKKATAADVLNARRLGFASLVILPASTDTVRKHLELAARYIPPSDEELGWSSPQKKAEQAAKDLPAPRDDPAGETDPTSSALGPIGEKAAGTDKSDAELDADIPSPAPVSIETVEEEQAAQSAPAEPPKSLEDRQDEIWEQQDADLSDTPRPMGNAPGRSGGGAEEEVFYL